MENTMYTEEEIRQAIEEAVSDTLSEYCANSIIRNLQLNKRELRRKEGIRAFLAKWNALYSPTSWTVSVILNLLDDYSKEVDLLSNPPHS